MQLHVLLHFLRSSSHFSYFMLYILVGKPVSENCLLFIVKRTIAILGKNITTDNILLPLGGESQYMKGSTLKRVSPERTYLGLAIFSDQWKKQQLVFENEMACYIFKHILLCFMYTQMYVVQPSLTFHLIGERQDGWVVSHLMTWRRYS